MKAGSWIVTSPDGRVIELYETVNVEKARAAGWRVETAGEYLGRINAREAWIDRSCDLSEAGQ